MKTILVVKLNEDTEEIEVRFVRGVEFGNAEQELDVKDIEDVRKVVEKISEKIKNK